ncbi:MAG: 2-hydroxy-acid oxidase [Phenylobacterium sp. RIFCSPHIGHO2_01_FULL_69_31]|uniref:glycolate oxidase subunit GlcF n=1 Tax=Phenylobacterium sp. RIFCSPHIGHO2_01_FULL_69_31 TaxID=1801944 RepID=UPI0008CB35AE|nr:glycolate oxidase subunit GlcF [Phenylobacterium sp. RIFCSPHIGHO2_01_FULL_69_31]OHB30873.1 MAG: 2-hydroxy-acid oxidase [Phenylobacterium sp. RIFCSPHIGHO2_01_FULL_69_31]
MRTAFTPEQLADPETAASQAAIRKCVHCGFCTATCPTYVLLGDERDSPRGRIELIREMLEKGGAPSPETVTHVDRCLSCLACTTTCPSGVDYARLIDHARAHIEAHHVRPWPQRILRAVLPAVLTRPRRLAAALALGRLARPLEPLLTRLRLAPLAALLRLVPPPLPRAATAPAGSPADGLRGRVILLQGCVEPAMAPQVRAAAIRLIARAGYEVVLAEGEGCCGALSEHLGRADEARTMARANLAAWAKAGPVDAIVTTAAGCGTMLKAYGRLVGEAVPARDVLEFIAEVGLPERVKTPALSVAYHAACSLQHGQQIKTAPLRLLTEAGFDVRTVAEGHLCCGSAGVYNILQPELATKLRDRKAANVNAVGAAVVAAGNVGCMAQLAPVLAAPVVHPVELLDWATGGPKPAALAPAKV